MSQVKTFGKNDVIFKEGDYGHCMYDIQSGSVNIYVNFGTEDEKLLTTLEAGQFFGELGIAEAMPRTATAIAAEDNTNLTEITAENFGICFRNEPQKLLTIMRHMSGRLRTLTQEYLEARETIVEAIDTAKSGQKQSDSLKGKLAKLVQNWRKPSFLKGNQAYEEASFLAEQGNKQYVLSVFRKNEVIFREGDAANCMYDIHWGRVGIYANYGADNQELLAELNADEFFGEMGLLDHMPRSATAVALEDNTKVQLISEELFSKYLQERPAKVMTIIMHLSSRIRGLTQDYLKVCSMAETAATDENNQSNWMDRLAQEIMISHSMCDYHGCYPFHRYWW